MSVRCVCSVPYTFLYCSNYVLAYALSSYIAMLFLLSCMLTILEQGSSWCGWFSAIGV